jgi:uncharacterized protein (TIGR03086 family)
MTTIDPRPTFRQAVATAGPIIGGVRPQQLDGPTPCTEFTVAQLLDHLLMVLNRVTVIGREGSSTVSAKTHTDWAGDWDVAARDCENAWADDAALARTVKLPWTEMSGADALRIYVSEVTVHTWDLATATGQRANWDPRVVAIALAAMRRELPAEGRQAAIEEAMKHVPAGTPVSLPFAEAVPVPEGAPLIDQLVGLTGRQP